MIKVCVVLEDRCLRENGDMTVSTHFWVGGFIEGDLLRGIWRGYPATIRILGIGRKTLHENEV